MPIAINEQQVDFRLDTVKRKSDRIMQILYEQGKIDSYEIMPKDIDIAGTDYIVGDKKVQFKIRADSRYQDIPVVYYQPFIGVDGEILENPIKNENYLEKDVKTTCGRDFRGLRDKVNDDYYVVSGVVFMKIKTEKLFPLIIKLNSYWEANEKHLWTKSKVIRETRNRGSVSKFILELDGIGQIWFKRNLKVDGGFESPKINFYIDKSHVDEEVSF